MGTSEWDGESWERGRSPRDGRVGRPDNRANYDRSMRGRPLAEDDRERSRGSRYDDNWRSSSGGRPARRPPDGPPGEWDSGRRSSANGRGRPMRDDRRDPYESRGSRDGRGMGDMERPGDRSMRGQRPPMRGDDRDGPQRGRGAPPAGARGRGPGRGGLWGDEEPMRRRPDGSDARGRTMAGGRIDPRDPRALRRGLVDTSMGSAVKDEKKGGVGVGMAFLIILLMFVIGVGAAFGYWKYSTPKLPVNNGAPAATPATNSTPSVAPNASPSPTKNAFAAPGGQVAIVPAGAL